MEPKFNLFEMLIIQVLIFACMLGLVSWGWFALKRFCRDHTIVILTSNEEDLDKLGITQSEDDIYPRWK